VGSDQKNSLTVLFEAGRASDPVDVGVDIWRAVHLHHPVHRREVEAPGGQVGGEQHRVGLAQELVVDGHAPQLVHGAVQAAGGHACAELVEGLVAVLDLLAALEEDDHLLVEVVADEGPEEAELLVGLADHVGLHEVLGRADGRVLVYRHVRGVLEAEPGQVLDGFGLRGAEEERLPRCRQVGHDRVHRLAEAHVQDPVRFV